MASADNVMVKIEVKASDLVEACIKALIEDGTLTEVVRCRECEWHDKCRYEQHLGLEGFCSKGERRDDVRKPDSDDF